MRYAHKRPCRSCGHTLRYVKGGGCVHCARARYKPAPPKPQKETPPHVRAHRQAIAALAAARRAGSATYKGRTCKRGHDGTRTTRNGRCIHCERDREAARGPHWRCKDKRNARRTAYRQSRRAATSGGPTGAQLRAILAAQLGGCAYCGRGQALHLDHKHPLALGGPHAMHNLQWLCRPCNLRKATTPDPDYRRRWLLLHP